MSGVLASLVILAAVLLPDSDVLMSEPATPAGPSNREISAEDKAVLSRAYLEFSMRNYHECLKILENAPIHPQTFNLRGAALLELGNKKDAASMFRLVLDLEPAHFWAQYNLAEIARATGDLDGARKRFLALPQNDPKERDIATLKLLLIDLQLDDEASARRQLPEWPPASAAGCAAYAAMAHREGNESQRAAILAEARRLHPGEWGIFLEKTLKESGVPVD